MDQLEEINITSRQNSVLHALVGKGQYVCGCSRHSFIILNGSMGTLILFNLANVWFMEMRVGFIVTMGELWWLIKCQC